MEMGLETFRAFEEAPGPLREPGGRPATRRPRVRKLTRPFLCVKLGARGWAAF